MVAPNYAAQRSELAEASGLGRKAPAKPAKCQEAFVTMSLAVCVCLSRCC
ncbi:hypothetical protein [Mesorhizobium sp. WSM3224]